MDGKRRVALWLGAAALVTLLVRTGWAAEDAYISFRVVDNFLAGYGLTWNVVERVQVYTDPLYVFLLIAATWLMGSVYWASVAVSLCLTMAAYFFLMDRRGVGAIAFGTAMLLSSKAFMDYSVSGMENPATHLGIAVFCWAYWRKSGAPLLTFIAALTAVNRLDSILLLAPALAVVYWRAGWRERCVGLLGLAPLVVWESFSLFYYGFPFPNTAYAKLNAALDRGELMRQGWEYLLNDWHWDKLTAVVILAGAAWGFRVGEWPLAVGILASVLYVMRVGGDYMAGRFLSPAFFLGCAILVRSMSHMRLSWKWAAAMTYGVLALGLIALRPSLTTPSDFGVGRQLPQSMGIVDERAFFYEATGVLRWKRNHRWPDFEWTDTGESYRQAKLKAVPVVVAGTIPYKAGPGVYVLDIGALGDALLARLPPQPGKNKPGHFYRTVPAGYMETVTTGANHLQDPKIAEYYQHLSVVIRGPLWSGARLREVVALNTGRYDGLLPKEDKNTKRIDRQQ